jgi:hypothetical protein
MMYRKNVFLCIVFICLFITFACQKGIHWDIESEGLLVKDSNNNCLPVEINGNYIQDSATNGNNYMAVDVNVTSVGSYSIYTDSINGYQFKASGNFNSTGTFHVKLACSGKPVTADTDYFAIHYNASICQATIIVKTNATPSAIFSLQGSPGKCLNDTVIATYTKGVVLDTSDKAIISVNVISPGRYDIVTNNVNGYAFKADGIFTATGVQTISIYPEGIPADTGINVFSVKGDSLSCNLKVKIKTDEAVFTLQGAPEKCMNDSVMGTYVKNIGLDTFSKVSIEVNVISAGRYNIKTNLVNGYQFLGGGIFTATGVQVITLYAQGTPANAGTDVFNITAGTSSCSFEVIVLADYISVNSDDYFPLTEGSYWIYDDLFTTGNTIKRTIDGDTTVNDTTYSIMKTSDDYGITDQSLYVKNNNNYLEYAREDKYTASIQYAKAHLTNLLFLKTNVHTGDYWESPEFQDETTFNQVIVLKYGYKCLKTDAVVTVNGKAFANVCIIEMRPQIHALKNPWGYTNEIYTYYYAKGIGLLYYYAVSNFGYKKAEWKIKSWHVN